MKKSKIILMSTIIVAALALQNFNSNAQTEPSAKPVTDESIRPFQIHIPEAQLTDLRQRVLATKWPERETVKDESQGVQLATMQALAHYWATEYDWRKVEARLNALPQF